MKKAILNLSSIFMFILCNPIFAQIDDPGEDPDMPVPISDYLWVLIAIGLVYVFFKFRAFAKQSNIRS